MEIIEHSSDNNRKFDKKKKNINGKFSVVLMIIIAFLLGSSIMYLYKLQKKLWKMQLTKYIMPLYV